jgi:hypothetical protein
VRQVARCGSAGECESEGDIDTDKKEKEKKKRGRTKGNRATRDEAEEPRVAARTRGDSCIIRVTLRTYVALPDIYLHARDARPRGISRRRLNRQPRFRGRDTRGGAITQQGAN